MKWEEERRSDNVEDRRGFSVGRGTAIGGGTIIVALVAALLGAPSSVVRSILGQGDSPASGPPALPGGAIDRADNDRVELVKVVLASTEDVWGAVLPASGRQYVRP